MTNFKEKNEKLYMVNKFYKTMFFGILVLAIIGIGSANTIIDSTSINQQVGTLDPDVPLHQYTPIISYFATANDYAESSASSIFHFCSWVENSGTTPTVAVFGEGLATGPGSWVWGGNFVAYTKESSNETSKAVGVEIDYGNLVSNDSAAVGLEITSQGDYASTAAISISSAPRETPPYNQNAPNTAILVQAIDGADPVGGANAAILRATGTNIPYGIEFANANFTGAAILLPNGDPAIYQRNSSDVALNLIGINGLDNLIIGDNTSIDMVYIRPNLTIESLAGSGNAFLCVDSTGQLYRNATACVP